MEIEILKSHRDDTGWVHRGALLTVEKARGDDLVRNGIAREKRVQTSAHTSGASAKAAGAKPKPAAKQQPKPKALDSDSSTGPVDTDSAEKPSGNDEPEQPSGDASGAGASDDGANQS